MADDAPKRASADDVIRLDAGAAPSSSSTTTSMPSPRDRPASVNTNILENTPGSGVRRNNFFNAVRSERGANRLSLGQSIGSYRSIAKLQGGSPMAEGAPSSPRTEVTTALLTSSVSLPDTSSQFLEGRESRVDTSDSPRILSSRSKKGSSIRMPSQANLSNSQPAEVPYDQKIQDEIALGNLSVKQENKTCADCGTPNPRWVSITFGTWLCSQCSNALRDLLGKAGANVQCLDFAWHYFGPDNVKMLEHLGNRRANEKFERKDNSIPKPTPTSDLTARINWMKPKYEDIQHLRSYHGYLNVTVAIRGSKKKLLWERRFLKLHDNTFEIFTKEDDPAPPVDSLDLSQCTVKEFNELDSWIVQLKDPKIDSKIAFELVTPKKFYVFNSSSSPELYEWVHTFRLIAIKSRIDGRKDETPRSFSGLEAESTPSSSVTKNPKLTREALTELLAKVAEEKEIERVKLRARLEQLNKQLDEKIIAREACRKRVEAVQMLTSESEAQKRRVELRICQLEPTSQMIQKTVVVQEEDNKIGGGLLLQDDGSIKGGTVTKLVAAVTHEGSTDTENLQAFLLTYRSFTTASDFLEKLKFRFQIQPPPYIDEETMNKFVNTRQRPIRLKVVNVVKSWINHHYYDFEMDSNLVLSLISFLDDVIEPAGMASTAEQLKRLLKKQIKGKTKEREVMLDISSIPTPILPADINNWTFMDLDPLEVARQLCLVEQELYRAIRPRECLNQAWNHKTQKETAAPNVLAMIRRFNRVSSWVTTTIVKKDATEERTRALQRLIIVAQHCRDLHNYNAVQEILSGLSASPCHRLKHTWAGLDQKTNQMLANLRKDLSNECNFQSLRNVLKTEASPAIPYLGMYLTDLTFIEDGNPDMLPGGLINFAKRRRIAGVIREIQNYQNAPYHLQQVKPIFDWLKDIEGLDENQAYTWSLAAEPKEQKTS